MARVSIYVPDDLKTRMDAAGEAINWSEIARRVFLEALANFEHRKGKNMSIVIERLRASKETQSAKTSTLSAAAGRRWASDKAEYGDLVRISQIVPGDDDGWASAALGRALDPEGKMDWSELSEYIGLDPFEASDENVLAGFIEGAQELYEEVKDDL